MPAARADAASRKTSRGMDDAPVEGADGQHAPSGSGGASCRAARCRTARRGARRIPAAGTWRPRPASAAAGGRRAAGTGCAGPVRSAASTCAALRLADARECAAARRPCRPEARGCRRPASSTRLASASAPVRRVPEPSTRASSSLSPSAATPRRPSFSRGRSRSAVVSHARLQRRQHLRRPGPQHQAGVRRQRRVVDVDLHDQGSRAGGSEREAGGRVDERRGADRRGTPGSPWPPGGRGRSGSRRAPRRTRPRPGAAALRTSRRAAGVAGSPRGCLAGRVTHHARTRGRSGPARCCRAVRSRRVLPARWCSPSTFCVISVNAGMRDCSRARARWPGLGAALPMMPRRHRYHCQTRRGSRANASGVARSVAL